MTDRYHKSEFLKVAWGYVCSIGVNFAAWLHGVSFPVTPCPTLSSVNGCVLLADDGHNTFFKRWHLFKNFVLHLLIKSTNDTDALMIQLPLL